MDPAWLCRYIKMAARPHCLTLIVQLFGKSGWLCLRDDVSWQWVNKKSRQKRLTCCLKSNTNDLTCQDPPGGPFPSTMWSTWHSGWWCHSNKEGSSNPKSAHGWFSVSISKETGLFERPSSPCTMKKNWNYTIIICDDGEFHIFHVNFQVPTSGVYQPSPHLGHVHPWLLIREPQDYKWGQIIELS